MDDIAPLLALLGIALVVVVVAAMRPWAANDETPRSADGMPQSGGG